MFWLNTDSYKSKTYATMRKEQTQLLALWE